MEGLPSAATAERNDRLHAQPDFAECACLLRKLGHERSVLVEMLRPLIDGLYEEGSYPGVAHNYLELKREVVVLTAMVELLSRLIPHEKAVRESGEAWDRAYGE